MDPSKVRGSKRALLRGTGQTTTELAGEGHAPRPRSCGDQMSPIMLPAFDIGALPSAAAKKRQTSMPAKESPDAVEPGTCGSARASWMQAGCAPALKTAKKNPLIMNIGRRPYCSLKGAMMSGQATLKYESV